MINCLGADNFYGVTPISSFDLLLVILMFSCIGFVLYVYYSLLVRKSKEHTDITRLESYEERNPKSEILKYNISTKNKFSVLFRLLCLLLAIFLLLAPINIGLPNFDMNLFLLIYH